ncbi:MAG: DUF4838 domain-containing protein [Alistipes sp.]|nr:DUF4838 domain-containing protein [Alistipes sp.]
MITLLEDYLGVKYYDAHSYVLQYKGDIYLPDNLHIEQAPAFRHRQTQYYGLRHDPLYKTWLRLEEPSEVFAANYWVHTFDRLMPSDVYGREHPEYYSLINGQRRPGAASQWCLSNPEVLEIAAARIDSIFKAHPDRHMISVSQNDGNFTYCKCPDCARIDSLEGSPAGSYVHFMNKLAERFPDKQISTLAYLFTMEPPRHVKPLPNVNIMLCSIDAKREVPLGENESGKQFKDALEGWAAITDNIFVWDYGINFDNYIAPFPNFHVIQPNIQLFKENNTTMHFSQVAGSNGGDFAELRAYLISKLMWDPYLNQRAVIEEFADLYYGQAAQYILRYIDDIHQQLQAYDIPLWIYDSPVSHKDGMLRKESRERYNRIFDLAEAAVAGDELRFDRVRKTRLPILFSDLEIMRAEGGFDVGLADSLLTVFETYTSKYGVPTINERNNSPADYCRLFRERYFPSKAPNIAQGAKVYWLSEPSGNYGDMGYALTDGIYGGTTFVESWVGWEGKDGSFVVDLGQSKEFSNIEVDCLHQLGAWILAPLGAEFYVSDDNENFRLIGRTDIPEDRSAEVKFVPVTFNSPEPLSARYIRVDVEGTKVCPSWHYGVGYPSWFFIDEVVVN